MFHLSYCICIADDGDNDGISFGADNTNKEDKDYQEEEDKEEEEDRKPAAKPTPKKSTWRVSFPSLSLSKKTGHRPSILKPSKFQNVTSPTAAHNVNQGDQLEAQFN